LEGRAHSWETPILFDMEVGEGKVGGQFEKGSGGGEREERRGLWAGSPAEKARRENHRKKLSELSRTKVAAGMPKESYKNKGARAVLKKGTNTGERR